jgi:hypothetical protein
MTDANAPRCAHVLPRTVSHELRCFGLIIPIFSSCHPGNIGAERQRLGGGMTHMSIFDTG